MASYTLRAVNGTQDVKNRQTADLFHDVALRAVPTSGGTPAGSVVVTGRKPGSDEFEMIPDGTFDIAALNSVQFTGAVAEWRVNISGITDVAALYLTDTSQRV